MFSIAQTTQVVLSLKHHDGISFYNSPSLSLELKLTRGYCGEGVI